MENEILRCILYSFHDTFRNTDPSALESDELASDGIIMDLTYSAERYDLVFNARFSKRQTFIWREESVLSFSTSRYLGDSRGLDDLVLSIEFIT